MAIVCQPFIYAANGCSNTDERLCQATNDIKELKRAIRDSQTNAVFPPRRRPAGAQHQHSPIRYHRARTNARHRENHPPTPWSFPHPHARAQAHCDRRQSLKDAPKGRQIYHQDGFAGDPGPVDASATHQRRRRPGYAVARATQASHRASSQPQA